MAKENGDAILQDREEMVEGTQESVGETIHTRSEVSEDESASEEDLQAFLSQSDQSEAHGHAVRKGSRDRERRIGARHKRERAESRGLPVSKLASSERRCGPGDISPRHSVSRGPKPGRKLKHPPVLEDSDDQVQDRQHVKRRLPSVSLSAQVEAEQNARGGRFISSPSVVRHTNPARLSGGELEEIVHAIARGKGHSLGREFPDQEAEDMEDGSGSSSVSESHGEDAPVPKSNSYGQRRELLQRYWRAQPKHHFRSQWTARRNFGQYGGGTVLQSGKSGYPVQRGYYGYARRRQYNVVPYQRRNRGLGYSRPWYR